MCVAFSVVATWAKKDSFRRTLADFPKYPAENNVSPISPQLAKGFCPPSDVANIGFQVQSYLAMLD